MGKKTWCLTARGEKQKILLKKKGRKAIMLGVKGNLGRDQKVACIRKEKQVRIKISIGESSGEKAVLHDKGGGKKEKAFGSEKRRVVREKKAPFSITWKKKKDASRGGKGGCAQHGKKKTSITLEKKIYQ